VPARRIAYSILVVLLVIMAGEIGYLYWREHQPKESPYDPIIVAVAREDGVDPFLIRALIWRESRFDPLTYGTAQEHGLMQVTPAVGEEWAKSNKIADFQPDDLFNPTTNIRAGTWYLSHAIRRWSQTDDPVTFALAEYNAGRSNALKWVDPNDPQNHIAFLDRITFPSTQKYVETILAKREEYRAILATNRWYRDNSTPASSVTLSP
jgi:soluble lytic murein transglycosylase